MKIETRNHFLYTLSVNFKSKLFLPLLLFFPPLHEWSGLMGVAASLAARGHNKQIAKTNKHQLYRQPFQLNAFVARDLRTNLLNFVSQLSFLFDSIPLRPPIAHSFIHPRLPQ